MRDQPSSGPRSTSSLGSATETSIRRARVVRAAALVGIVLVLGSVGFYALDGGRTSLLDCVYMTVITVTTVGYEEIIPRGDSPTLTIFTILVILVGVGAVLYLLTTLAAMVVEGDLHHRLWRRRMEKQIQNLRDHVVVVGVGRCGS